MAFRDDHEAALARAEALDRENAELRARLAKLEQPATPGPGVAASKRGTAHGGPMPRARVMATIVAVCGLGGGIAAAMLAGEAAVGVVIVSIAAVIACAFLIIGRLVVVPMHDELLVISGRRTVDASGQVRGYRIASATTVPFPVIERVDRMSLAAIPIELSVRGAYTTAGIAVNLKGTGAVRIVDTPPAVYDAIDRFLGRSPEEIATVARETLEGHVRSCVATLSVEEIAADHVRFADEVLGRAADDLEKLGLAVTDLAVARELE